MISVMKMEEKTNAMRYLDSKKIKYESFFYGDGVAISGPEVARELGGVVHIIGAPPQVRKLIHLSGIERVAGLTVAP